MTQPDTSLSQPQRSLRVNTVWAITGNVLHSGSRFAIVLILTKAFASDQVGRVLYALAVVTPLSFLINMELRSVYVTDTRDWVRLGDCLAVRAVSNALLLLALITLCLLQAHHWSLEQRLLILLAGTVRMAESWADIYLGVLQKKEHMKRWTISQVSKALGVLASVLFTALCCDNPVWMFLGWTAAVLVVLWFYDRPQAARFTDVRVHWHNQVNKELVRRAFPLGVFVALAIMNHYVGQYYIAPVWGDSAVAYFGVLWSFIAGAAAVQNGVDQAVQPRLARYCAYDPNEFRLLLLKVLLWSWAAMAGLLLAVYLAGPTILSILYDHEYAKHADVFLIVALAGCIMMTGMILGDTIVACHRFKSRMLAVAAGVALNAALCSLWVKPHGLTGAAWAAVASAALTTAICLAVLLHANRTHKVLSND